MRFSIGRAYVICLVLCTADETCQSGADDDGICKSTSGKTSGYTLPPCKETFELERLATDSKSWCDPAQVPAAKRAPKKLQGLFWLKGLPLDDVAACFSNGEWDESTLTLKLVVWKDFMFMDTTLAIGLVTATYASEMTYLVKFQDANLTDADIKPTGNVVGKVPMSIFASLATFPLNELPASTPGEKWARPSYFGLGSHSLLTNEYEAWRILDGDLKVNEENLGVMFRLLGPRLQGTKINRFHAADGNGQCGDTEHSKPPQLTEPAVSCSSGVLLVLTNQPTLGVRYLAPAAEPTVFARAEGYGCTTEYLLLCVDGVVSVQRSQTCAASASASTPALGAGPQLLKAMGWQECADHDEETELRVTVQFLHQTWDIEVSESTPVAGCIELRSAAEWPEFAAATGLAEQRHALVARKKAVGGCPFFKTSQDREARGHDFGSVFGYWLRGIQHEQGVRAEMWERGVGTWGTPPGFVDRMRANAGVFASLSFLGGASKQNRTVAFGAFAEVNCGEPAPFADGPQVFRHEDVWRSTADPSQVRGYRTATVEQTEACFDASLPLFQSSGTPEHDQARKLLDEAGLDRMHLEPLPDVEGVVPLSVKGVLKSLLLGDSAPGEKEVGHFVVPLVMEALWQKRPSDALVEQAVSYLDDGKICIFGKKAEDLMLLNPINKPGILRTREAVAAFGRDSPRARTMAELLDKPEYAALKAQYAARGRPPAEVLVSNLADAMLFAGVLGTTDMTTKCVQYARRDKTHLRQFRKDPAAYLHELMRYDGAVTSFTTALKEPTTMRMEGRDVNFEAGTPVQMVLASANRDEAVFADASRFDPDRPEANETLAWNGRLGDVIARNYTGAPRFCPGYHASIKIATAVCQHLTKDLHEWGRRPSLQLEGSNKLALHGTVKILKGPYASRAAQISYVTKSGEYCVVDKSKFHQHLGCFLRDELEQLSFSGSFSRSLTEELDRCPPFAASALQMAAGAATSTYQANGALSWAMKHLVMKHEGTPQLMTADWAGPYLVPMYSIIVHGALRMYKARHADSVRVPEHTGRVEEFTVGTLSIPGIDIDYPAFIPLENLLPQAFYDNFFLPSFNCFMSMVRNTPFEDFLDSEDMNQWHLVMQSKRFARKKDWIYSWFESYQTQDGDGVFPEQEIDFTARFLQQGSALKADEWQDGLEKSIAFDLIGAHRVRTATKEAGGETLRYVIELNEFGKLETRPHFGKYGCDMYFTEHGLPALIVTTDGREVVRGDKEWQYWKFVWRSSFLTIVTLVDHLYLTHFRAASTLAKATRATLSPDNPVRRFLSVFTFGSIFVNLNAAHTLVGPDHTLHRATPFVNFADLSGAVPEMLADPFVMHAPMADKAAFDRLPELVKQSPYFSDGKLLFAALDKLAHGFIGLYHKDICVGGADGYVAKNTEMFAFMETLLADHAAAHYKPTWNISTPCSEMTSRLTMLLWIVTGWHRHVGTVGDYYLDPELAAMSWKEGERHSRPLQHMVLSTITVFTGTKQPKLIEDFTHVFKGIDKEKEAIEIWKEFSRDLQEVSKTIQQRNEKRDIKNIHADPHVVECSVAV